ncbi:MAG: DEAD/DEAH box helicase family protein [Oscillospiraceae bacterium]|nr:DEAD/DEAH box helicase family protein [Oscillospiraceae bacterium]
MGDKHLSEVINYQRDIEPYRIVKVYSGVGSGKTTFACRFVTGCKDEGEEVPDNLTTLIITSRRAKVEETLTELGAEILKPHVGAHGNLVSDVLETGEERPEEYEKFVRVISSKDPFIGEYVTHNQSVVCTNAYIEYHLKHCYVPNDPSTHLWDLFDVIIIDEVHSLITDATYQTAPFAVMELIKEYLKRCANPTEYPMQCKHLILMTGSPAPFEECADITVPEGIGKEYSVFDECINVVPKSVLLLDSTTARYHLQGILYESKSKAVYFTNHIMDRGEAKSTWRLDDTINVAVSYSDEDRRKTLVREEKDAIKEVEDELKKGWLPEDLDLFVTTSRNKEGININNTDIPNMFVESHFSGDIIQMAGRVRYGVENLYIVTDAKQLCNGPDFIDIGFTTDRIVKNEEERNPDVCGEANSYLRYFCENNKITNLVFNRNSGWNIHSRYGDTLGKYIEYIESRFHYMRYSYFDNRFKFYRQKMLAELLVSEENEKFSQAVTEGDEAVKSLVSTWFPEANVHLLLGAKERAAQMIENRIGAANYVELSQKEWESFFAELVKVSGIKGEYGNPFLAQLGNYGIEPIRSSYQGTIGNRILYKGQNPLDMRKKRNPTKKSPKRK